MGRRRGLLLIISGCILTLLLWKYDTTTSRSTMTPPHFNAPPLSPYFTDTIASFKYRKLLEYRYRAEMGNTSSSRIELLGKLYHRDVTLQMSRDLLPATAGLFSPLCIRYISSQSPPRPVSVVISYHNEMPYLLLRTLTTLVHRTPPSLLHEVVLVDDASSDTPLADVVSDFASVHGVSIKYHRSEIKLGITRARRWGIELSSGGVVAVLDSHMEVGVMWIEPLLDVIATRPASIAVPCIRMISEQNYTSAMNPQLPYTVSLLFGMGTISFDGSLPDDFPDYTDHYRSPGLAGGALLASRDTLLRLYPESSTTAGWGVENSRLAVRAWLCGEGVFMSCCSMVVHPNGNDPHLSRYFEEDANLFHSLLLESTVEVLNFIPDRHERIKWALRVAEQPETLLARAGEIQFNTSECRPFSEYVHNIHPHSVFDMSDSHAVGQVHSLSLPWLCHEKVKGKAAGVIAARCRKFILIDDDQLVGFNNNGALRTSYNNCWSYHDNTLLIKPCRVKRGNDKLADDAQIFTLQNNQIRHVATNKCLAFRENYNKTGIYPDLVFTSCDPRSELQQWGVKPARWL